MNFNFFSRASWFVVDSCRAARRRIGYFIITWTCGSDAADAWYWAELDRELARTLGSLVSALSDADAACERV